MKAAEPAQPPAQCNMYLSVVAQRLMGEGVPIVFTRYSLAFSLVIIVDHCPPIAMSPIFELEKLELVFGPWGAWLPNKPDLRLMALRIFQSE